MTDKVPSIDAQDVGTVAQVDRMGGLSQLGRKESVEKSLYYLQDAKYWLPQQATVNNNSFQLFDNFAVPEYWLILFATDLVVNANGIATITQPPNSMSPVSIELTSAIPTASLVIPGLSETLRVACDVNCKALITAIAIRGHGWMQLGIQ